MSAVLRAGSAKRRKRERDETGRLQRETFDEVPDLERHVSERKKVVECAEMRSARREETLLDEGAGRTEGDSCGSQRQTLSAPSRREDSRSSGTYLSSQGTRSAPKEETE